MRMPWQSIPKIQLTNGRRLRQWSQGRVEEIKNHYVILLEDINAIESGSVPLPHYVPLVNDYTNLSSDFGVGKMGSHYGQMQSDSHHGGKLSRSDQERRRGIAWTEEEHR